MKKNLKIELFGSESIGGNDFIRVIDGDNKFIGGILSGEVSFFTTNIEEVVKYDGVGNKSMQHKGTIFCSEKDLISLLSAIKAATE